MSHSLETSQAAALAADHFMGAAFVRLDFAAPIFLSSLPYDMQWNDGTGIKTWKGAGNLGTISPVSENADLQATGVSLTLAGLDPSFISTALGEQYQGKAIQIWFCPLNTGTGQLIGTPLRIYAGRIDTMDVEAGETASITLTGEGRLVDFFRPRVARYTDAEQQARFPGDLGLQYVSSLQDKTITWGRA
jgi:hypothetical protein